MIKTSQLESYNKRVADAVARRRFSEAFALLDSMAAATMAPWEIRNAIDKLRESYGYLRRYAIEGMDDPAREEMLQGIGSGLMGQAAAIMRRQLIDDSPKMYFGVIRYELLQSDSSIPQLVADFRKADGLMSMTMFSHKDGESDAIMKRQAHLLQRLFNLIWVSYPLTSDDENVLTSFLRDTDIRVELREQLLGAVMLGALEYFDERRFTILASVYLAGEKSIEIKALVLLLISLWIQRDSLTGRRLHDVMAAVKEHKGWREDLKMVFLNLVRTRDTARISRTMNEEVIPRMLKLRPDILKKFKEKDIVDEMTPEGMNPEWEELLEQSGVGEKLRELNDLQSEGGDVMLSTFSGLKGFPFFHDVSNWFAPFYTEQPDVAKVLDDSAADLGEMIDMAPMICDNDKYSIIFSLQQLPSSNRRMMLEQFKLQNVNLAELRNTMLNPEMNRRNDMANNYIHDLYRFFTLFRRKSEFVNPFASPVNLAAVGVLSSDLMDTLALEAVGEFYFKRGYYAEAADVFNLLFATKGTECQLLQKAGYCHQQLGRFEKALEFYLKSELAQPDSLWNLRRIAQCYKLLGRQKEALGYYQRLASAKPSDIGIALNLGHCHLALGNYEEALKCYYKVEYLDEKSGKALRPLAWCNFVTGNYDRASHYYDEVLNDNPSATDHLNIGHLFMAMREYVSAVNHYTEYLVANGNDINKLSDAINADREYLDKAGVDPLMTSLVVDAAAYPQSL